MLFTKENAYAMAMELFPRFGEDRTEHEGKVGQDVAEFLELCEKMDAFTKPRKPGSGRKDGLTKKKTVEILRAIEAGSENTAPRHYLERIVMMGYLEKKSVETGKRGRRPVEYVLSGKGRGYLALSKNWKV